jgi:hypothetical protein
MNWALPTRPIAISVISLAILLPTTVMSAAEEATQLAPVDLEFFEKNVRPILVARCYECHSDKESNGGLTLDNKLAILDGGDTGAALVPGKPDESLLIEAIRYGNRDLQMPPKNRLPDAEIAILEEWVGRGAPDPRVAAVDAAPLPVGMSIAAGRRFWSFRPVSNPQIPSVNLNATPNGGNLNGSSTEGLIANPIDAFILAELEKNGLQPSPTADKRTLLRRMTFDLIGLPPTRQEIQDFLDDKSPDATRKVIDRLLDSPQYGVRWGRHWLDVARYADSNGLDENLALGNAWRYRDYVITAFNDDKPYDQFVTEQIAGDLIPHATLDSKTATGFLVLGAKVLAEPDREKLFMDTIDEQLDATGKVFLGLTVGCARCHDHKFDPIKQTDYYALAAILKSTKTYASTNTGAIKHWHEYEFPTAAEKVELKKVQAEIGRLNGAASAYKNQATAKLRAAVKAQAVEYLIAATRFGVDATLTDVIAIAEPMGLHPRILHHCRLHLAYNQDHPFFETWHKLQQHEKHSEAVAAHYRPMFTAAEVALAKKKETDAAATAVDDPALQMVHSAVNDASGFLAIPPKPEFAFDAETLQAYYKLLEAARVYESAAPDVPSIMGVSESAVVEALPIHIRGSHLNLGEPVAREFPEVMRLSPVRPIFPSQQSGRLELARWMTSSQNPLTARVYVNRIWGWHFGRGIVGTTENFGKLGDRPSHPALLDWLARHFMQQGWSTKEMHRLIMTSYAYQRSAVHPSPSMAADFDPDNRLLWKAPLRRHEAEVIRDSILAVAGRLDYSIGGKTVPLRNRQFVFNHTSVDHTRYESLRRAAYLPVIRNNVYAFFAQFDFPDPTMPTGSRNSTVVAPQALLLMNSDLVMDSAETFAGHLLSLTQDMPKRIQAGYEICYGREPTTIELKRVAQFIDNATAEGRVNSEEISPEVEQRAWALFCQAMFASNEFIYVK